MLRRTRLAKGRFEVDEVDSIYIYKLDELWMSYVLDSLYGVVLSY
jgi:hypothetical protein